MRSTFQRLYRYNFTARDSCRLAAVLLTKLLDQPGLWRERARQRRALMALDDRLLRDIGISRADAEREVAKPFWRG